MIGGGNTAMDAASESARLGAEEVFLAYRRSKAEMGAYYFEYDLAKSAGTQGVFNVTPVRILGKGKVEGICFARTRSENGRLKVIPNSEFEMTCDMVIKSTGQSKMKAFFDLIEGLEIDESGRIKVDKKTFQTSNPMYFAAGDAVNGGAEVVNAVGEAKKAAKGIYKFVF